MKKHLIVGLIVLHVYLESSEFNKFIKRKPDHMVHVTTSSGELVINPENIIIVNQDTKTTMLKIKTDKGENFIIVDEDANSINDKIEKAKNVKH